MEATQKQNVEADQIPLTVASSPQTPIVPRGVSQPQTVSQRQNPSRHVLSKVNPNTEQNQYTKIAPIKPPLLVQTRDRSSSLELTNQSIQSPKQKHSQKKDFVRPWQVRFNSYTKLAIPAVASYFLIMLQEQIDVIFVSQLKDTIQLAAIGLGNMVINIWCLSLLFGVNTALETLVSQAFGRNNLKECSLNFQKAIILSTILFIPIIVGVSQMESLLIWFGMDADASLLAQQYVWYQLPGIMLHCYADSIDLTLAAMGYTYITALFQVLVIPVHIASCWFFTQYYQFGILGTSYAMNVSQTFTLMIHLVYVLREEKIHTVFGTTPDFNKVQAGLYDFMKFSAPYILMLFLDWANWEVLVLMTGQFQSNEMLSAMVLICAIGNFFMMIPTGLSVAAVAQVGNALGRNKPKEAQADAKLVLQVAICGAFSVGLGIALFRHKLLLIYCEDEELKEIYNIAEPVLLFYSLGFFFDWLQNNACGLIKAANKQTEASIASLISMIFVSFPIAWIMGIYFEYGLMGLWCGYLVQNISLTVINIYFLLQVDWNKAAEEASADEIAKDSDDSDSEEDILSITRVRSETDRLTGKNCETFGDLKTQDSSLNC